MRSLQSVEDVLRLLAQIPGPLLDTESVDLAQAAGRVLAADIISRENLPPFDRSTVDGFAVRAADTFGASETLPAFLRLAGSIRMGEWTERPLQRGETMAVATGGMLPPGADSVVMVEHTEALGEEIAVLKPVTPGENRMLAGEDAAAGKTVIPAGVHLGAPEIGVLAALGYTKAWVYARPKVGIISSGDEIVPPDQPLPPGRIRDINSYMLAAAVHEVGGSPRLYGIAPDDFQSLYHLAASALAENDLLLLSGGSSVGSRDHTAAVISALGEPGVLVHGIAVKPGKPTLIGLAGGKAVFGLPGHPVSAFVIFRQFVRPFLLRAAGIKKPLPAATVRAVLTQDVPSMAGRTDFVRVDLHFGEHAEATPVWGKSGLVTTLLQAGGLLKVSAAREGVRAGETVEVELW